MDDRVQRNVFVSSITSGSLTDSGETVDRRVGSRQRQLWRREVQKVFTPKREATSNFPVAQPAAQVPNRLTYLSRLNIPGSEHRLISLYSGSNTSFKSTRRDMLRCLYIRHKNIVLWPGKRYLVLIPHPWVPHYPKNLRA